MQINFKVFYCRPINDGWAILHLLKCKAVEKCYILFSHTSSENEVKRGDAGTNLTALCLLVAERMNHLSLRLPNPF